MANFEYEKEILFANTLYNNAIKDLEDNEIPPSPEDWLKYRNELVQDWKDAKIEIEKISKESDEDYEHYKTFLKTGLFKYMEHMCIFARALDKFLEEESEESEELEEVNLRASTVDLNYPRSRNIPIQEESEEDISISLSDE